MNENPYQSPQMPAAPSVPLDDNPMGTWRDGNLLVVRLRYPQFPPRCVKTNQACYGPPTQLNVSWLPNRLVWILLFGAIGHLIAKSLVGKNIPIQFPLSPEWLSKRRQIARIGWAMIVGGSCFFVLATVAYVLAMMSGMDEGSSQWIMFAALASPFVAIAGVVYMSICHKPIMTVRNMTDQHAWIDGIHPLFLDSLPEWRG